MQRRDFLGTAGGLTTVGVVGASGTASGAIAQEDGQSGGGTKEIIVGPGGDPSFEPDTVTVPPGTTIAWTWESNNHNIVVESQPEETGWEGTSGPPSKTYDTGHTYQHAFETVGTYEYFCEPHKQLGMVGTVEVKEGATLGGGGGGGGGEKKPREMGVPIRAHYVGIAAILAITVTLAFTFFQLKYGESPHAGGGGN